MGLVTPLSLTSWASEGSLRWSCVRQWVRESESLHPSLERAQTSEKSEGEQNLGSHQVLVSADQTGKAMVVQWPGQVGRKRWAGPWLSPAWLPSAGERGSWGSLSLSHLCLVVIFLLCLLCFSTMFVPLLLHPPFLFLSLLLCRIL